MREEKAKPTNDLGSFAKIHGVGVRSEHRSCTSLGSALMSYRLDSTALSLSP